MPVDSSHRKAFATEQPLCAMPTTTFPSAVVSVARLRDVSQGRAPGVNDPSSFHSVARTQMAACRIPRESGAVPTMVRPSRLTSAATVPPMEMTPVVGIQ
jgi:hypothetical protein